MNSKISDKSEKKYLISNIADNWDIDCECNMLNDLCDDAGFHEDKIITKNKWR